MTAKGGMYRPGRGRAAVWMTAVIVGAALIPGTPAGAHDDLYGWTGCSQRTIESGNADIRFRMFSFPGDFEAPSGVVNSFTGRADGAASQWSLAFDSAGESAIDVVRTNGSTYEIEARYADITALGQVSWMMRGDGSSSSCVAIHQVTPDHDILLSQLRIDLRSDWFTQDDSRRSFWEGCPSRNYDRDAQGNPSYTCSKTRDFGSTFAHELGHAVGALVHPSQVDSHRDDPDFEATAAANCANDAIEATMCTGLTTYRTAWRTLDAWDYTSLDRHYDNNGV